VAFAISVGDAEYYWNADASVMTVGEAVFQSAIGQTMKAIATADVAGTSVVVGVVLDSTVSVGAQFRAISSGPVSATTAQWDAVTGQSGGLTPGAAYYLSPTVPGRITPIPPTDDAQYIVYVGTADSATVLSVSVDAPAGPIGGPIAPPVTTRDATSLKLVPATSAEWDNLLGSVGDNTGGPTSIYLMQDASVGAVDVNGTHNLLEVVAGAGHYSYQNSMTGWTRKAVGTSHANVDIGFVKQGGSLPSETTHSYLLLAYVMIQSDSGVDTGILSVCNASFRLGMKTGTRYPSIGDSGGERSVGSKALPLGTVIPVWIKYDITRKTIKVYTPYEIVNQFYSGPSASGPEIDWGVALATGLYASNALYAYGAAFIGPAAEKSDAAIGAITEAMGWDISWADTTVVQDGPGTAVYCPQGALQWRSLLIAPPTLEWALQETSGVVYTESEKDCLLVGQAGTSAGGALTGWTRRGLATVDGTVSCYANSSDTRLPDPRTTSVAMLLYANVSAAAFGSAGSLWSWIFGLVNGYFQMALMDTSGHVGMYTNSVITRGAIDHRGVVRPYLLVYDVTNARLVLYTNAEKVTSSSFHLADTAGQIALGSTSPVVPCAGFKAALFAAWSGAQAEYNDAKARTLLQKLGWTVSW
jgi:hypothetical protein